MNPTNDHDKETAMPDWQLALLLTLGAAILGGALGVVVFRAHLASERRWRR